MTMTSGALVRLMNSCEPHLEQNCFRRFLDEANSERSFSPEISSDAAGTAAFVEKAAPCALRHIEQWQFSVNAIGAETL